MSLTDETSASARILTVNEPSHGAVGGNRVQPLDDLCVIGLNHRTATVDIRGQLAVASERLPSALQHLRGLPGVAECMLLSTCNRTEVYAVANNSAALLSGLAEWFALPIAKLHPYLYHYRGADSVKHLFRVACGLDSAVLGETQILGQLKRAYAVARENECAGPLLSRLNEHAWSTAKRVRTDTGIGRCPVSLAGIAASQIAYVTDRPTSARALVVGAGENAELVLRHLVSRHVGKITIANRGLERARRLAAQFGGEAIGLDQLEEAIVAADVIVSTTGAPSTVLSAEVVRAARRQRGGKPQLLLDLAVPADIETAAGDLPGVELLLADDLARLARANIRSRQDAADKAETMLERGVHAYAAWLRTRTVVPTIRLLRRNAEEHRKIALERAHRHLASGMAVEDVLDYLSRHLTNRMLHAPMKALHDSAERQEQQSAIAAAQQLYGLTDDSGDVR